MSEPRTARVWVHYVFCYEPDEDHRSDRVVTRARCSDGKTYFTGNGVVGVELERAMANGQEVEIEYAAGLAGGRKAMRVTRIEKGGDCA